MIKTGENLTIFAPNDKAFEQQKDKDPLEDKESKKNFLNNHVIVGQRVPIYPNHQEQPENDQEEAQDTPKILRANIIIRGGPLVHVIDRVSSQPINSMSLLAMQPAISVMMKLLKSVNMRDTLDRKWALGDVLMGRF